MSSYKLVMVESMGKLSLLGVHLRVLLELLHVYFLLTEFGFDK